MTTSTNVDRTTKLLLAGILVGIWLHLFVAFRTSDSLNEIQSHTFMIQQWLLNGAPVRQGK